MRGAGQHALQRLWQQILLALGPASIVSAPQQTAAKEYLMGVRRPHPAL